jgi:hypothetical protein
VGDYVALLRRLGLRRLSSRKNRTRALKAPRDGVSEEIGHAAHPRRHEPAFGPDEAHVSDALHEIIENRGDVGMREVIGQRHLGEEADAKAGENADPDRLDAVG